MKNNLLKKCIIYALMSAIIVVQKITLAFIPNFQFSTLLLVLFFFVFGSKPTLLITLIYVIVDNLYLGTLHLIYTPVMFFAWASIIITLLPLKKHKDKVWILGLIGGLHALIYSACFGITSALIYEVDILTYIISDIPYTLILIGSNFLTIIWLFKPLYLVMDKYYNAIIVENDCKKR